MSKPTSNTEQYDRLLAEAEQVKGTSLWKDAWKRLRRNWVAMGALGYLVVLALAAFLTPMLPLQSPIKQDLKYRKFLAPHVAASQVFDAEQLAEIPQESRTVKLDLTRRLADIDSAREELQRATSEAEREAARIELGKAQAAYQATVGELWNNPGPVSRGMIRARVAMLGDRCLPSLAGTDHLGRDVLARVFWGARVSLIVGLVATLVSLVIGVTYGATAGYVGGWVDNVMMRIVDILYSIPFIFIVIFIITILNDASVKARLESVGLNKITLFYLIIGAIYWLTMSRVVRGQVISLKNDQFVEAARTIGASQPRIIFVHLIPNVLSIVIVYLTLTIPAVMLFEAFLSFLGLGVDPPDVSWGLLANEGVKVLAPSNESIWKATIFWWIVLFPGLALALTLFALNFLGDGLRDALDPRMKNR